MSVHMRFRTIIMRATQKWNFRVTLDSKFLLFSHPQQKLKIRSGPEIHENTDKKSVITADTIVYTFRSETCGIICTEIS